jgi:hypothetical protein
MIADITKGGFCDFDSTEFFQSNNDFLNRTQPHILTSLELVAIVILSPYNYRDEPKLPNIDSQAVVIFAFSFVERPSSAKGGPE